MARTPSSWGPNVIAPDSDYPSGRSKDTPNGTPMKELTMGDFQQFFFKWLRMAGITANGLPDNEYNGLQYIQAVLYLLGTNGQFIIIDGAPASTPVDVDAKQRIIILPTAQSGQVVSLGNPGVYSGLPEILNFSPYPVDVYTQTGETISGSPPPYSLATMKRIALQFDFVPVPDDWIITEITRLYPLDTL